MSNGVFTTGFQLCKVVFVVDLHLVLTMGIGFESKDDKLCVSPRSVRGTKFILVG